MTTGTDFKARRLIALHLLFALYSLAGVLSKLAAGHAPLSLPFLLLYGGMLAVLLAYAVCWQQALKRLPLSVAYCNKAVTVAWGLFWGALLFGEAVSAKKLAGVLIVSAGVFFVTAGSKTPSSKNDGQTPNGRPGGEG